MPTKWLSIRKLNPICSESESQCTIRPQEFDFAFGEQPPTTQATPPRAGPRLVQTRPTTSGGTTGKRKLPVEEPSSRPRTTENHKTSPLPNTNAISKSEDSFIGLAFGSPSHPPANFSAPSDELGSAEQNHFSHRYQAGQMQSKRWRKFGTLFKSRLAVKRDEVPSGPTISLPTGLVVLDKDPPMQQDNVENQKSRLGYPERPDRDFPPPPPKKDDILGRKAANLPVEDFEEDPIKRPFTADATDAGSSVQKAHSRPPIPKLELAIPRNLDFGQRSTSLLARRSKTLESLKSFEDSRPTIKTISTGDSVGSSKGTSEDITPLMPPRRLTTPTMTKSPAASKYSLFPTTSPALVKFIGRVPSSEHETLGPGQLKRSVTSPARLSPMQDRFSIVPTPEPLNPRRTEPNDQESPSPEDNTASTDRSAPWSSAHSFQSSVSSATTVDEIFFDIKSFRDSKGVEDGQFVMTRPDSAQVELARTRSKKAFPGSRLRQMEAFAADEGSEQTTPVPSEPPAASTEVPSAWPNKHSSVNTAYFDEAIAAVERLTTPIGSTANPGKMTSIPKVTIAHHDDKPLQQVSKPQFGKPSEPHLRLTSKSHGEVSRLIPSPVVEVRENDLPKTYISPTMAPISQTAEQNQFVKVVSPRMAAMKYTEWPIADSPTIPRGPSSPERPPMPSSPLADKPPPVPKKDAKFIPMSKYAPKGTVVAIEKRAGITPKRPVRANTEDLAQPSSPPRSPKERSATQASSLQSQPHHSPQNSSLRGLVKAVPHRPNPVGLNPIGTAEVAVARTVSLSRKQSARVLVPGPRLAARRAEAHAQPAAQPKRQPSTHSRNVSTTSQKSTKSTKSILGHRHKRTTSSAKSAIRQSTDFSASRTKVTKASSHGKSGSFGKCMWSKESEKQRVKEARKWEILEKKSYSPVVVQAERGHRHGLSIGLVVEST